MNYYRLGQDNPTILPDFLLKMKFFSQYAAWHFDEKNERIRRVPGRIGKRYPVSDTFAL
jgi:hypothetical protein